jgi:hypothetical protein
VVPPEDMPGDCVRWGDSIQQLLSGGEDFHV